jgi:multiple sugar transport system substrate-binding protein
MKFPTKLASGLLASALALSLGACGGSPSSSTTASKTQSAAGPVTINVWAWEPTLKAVVTAFEAANPNITVNLQNVGGAGDTYTKLDNAISAGSGAPDVAQVEYYAIGQYAIPGKLADLTQFGAADLSKSFTTGTWNAVTLSNSGKVYGLPVDSGPMALFYNKATFDKAGITQPPVTWDEYYQDAKKIHALGKNYYITTDNGDAGFATSMMWQTGAKPFQVSSGAVTINLGDSGVVKFADFWQKMISEDLINTKISGWSDDWFKGLGDGSVASLITGAWMPANLIGSAPKGAGNFRVAATPVPTAGTPANSENGGSSLAVLASSQKKEAAYKFLQFTSAGDGVAIRIKGGNFPSTTADLAKPDFLGYTDTYFGGQQYNQVLAQAAKDVLPGWSYLPYQVYANSIFGDKVKDAYSGKGNLKDAYAAWQTDLEKYGKDNGFIK